MRETERYTIAGRTHLIEEDTRPKRKTPRFVASRSGTELGRAETVETARRLLLDRAKTLVAAEAECLRLVAEATEADLVRLVREGLGPFRQTPDDPESSQASAEPPAEVRGRPARRAAVETTGNGKPRKTTR